MKFQVVQAGLIPKVFRLNLIFTCFNTPALKQVKFQPKVRIANRSNSVTSVTKVQWKALAQPSWLNQLHYC